MADDSSDPEFASFSGAYDIDIDANTISMTFNRSGAPISVQPGVVPNGTFDRYYFTFDLASNESISAVSASTNSSLQPNVSFNGNTVVVEIGPGMEVGPGFDALINVNILRSGTVITGRAFQDADQDGNRNFDEQFLNGWTVELRDLDQNTVVATTTTRSIDLNGDSSIDPETETGVYSFTDVPAGTYVVQEVVPEGWIQTAPNSPSTIAAFNLDAERQFAATDNDFLNWGGLNEKWFYGLAENGSTAPGRSWYYVVPDGSIFRWNGSPRTALTGTLVTQLDPTFHEDPSLIYNAPSPRQYIADVDVASPTTFRGLDFGNYLPATDFTVTVDQETNEATIDWDAITGASYDVWISDIAAGRQFQFVPDLNGANIPLITQLPDRRYRVWIRTNSMGASSPWSSPQEFELFRDAVNLISTPPATTIDATPTIEWVSLAGASSYDIRVTNGDEVVYLQNDIAELSHRIANPLEMGIDYRVAVRANFPDGSQTAWDAGLPLRIDGRPTATVVGRNLAWTPVAAATEYEVWINSFDDEGNLLESQIVSAMVIDELNFTIPVLEDGNYGIWVRAIRAEDNDRHISAWSSRVNIVVTSNDRTDGSATELLALNSVTTALRSDVEVVNSTTPAANQVDATVDEQSEPTASESADVAAVMAELSTSDLLHKASI